MASRIALAAGAALALTPAAIAFFWPAEGETASFRSVQLDGPFVGFTQSHDRIQVRLTPASSDAERDKRSQVIIRDPEGEEFAIPLKRGQTWASAELPAGLVRSSELKISVE